jgi:DNA invertase Pin-like site-specific DNA recombinase
MILRIKWEVLIVRRIYGYARVSSTEQHLDRQIDALIAYGVEDRYIIKDKCSGKDFDRPGYMILKNQLLRDGDVLVIKELDRLGRNYEQIKSEWHDLQQMGVDIVVLDMPIASTADKSDLEKKLIVNIVFELLAYLAEKERLKIKTRQAEGIAAAKAKGVKFGRPKTKIPQDFIDEVRKWKAGEQTATATMQALNLKRTTFYKLVKEVIV